VEKKFIGFDGKYHPLGWFWGVDGEYHPKEYFLGRDGKYHPKGSFIGTDGKYVEPDGLAEKERQNQDGVDS
jgi:hypothetical protein